MDFIVKLIEVYLKHRNMEKELEEAKNQKKTYKINNNFKDKT
jgi:hypothetical protein